MLLLLLLLAVGGENGFNQAIELSADMLSNVKFVQEKRLISRFFDEISQDTGKFVFSVKVGAVVLDVGARGGVPFVVTLRGLGRREEGVTLPCAVCVDPWEA